MSEKAPTVKRGTKVSSHALTEYISQFTTLSEAEHAAIAAGLNVRQFRKGDVLLREGQIAKLCYFVLQGCVRQYYLVDGLERTTYFYTEGQPITPYEGSYQRRASKYYLDCVEDCLLNVGTPEEETRLFAQFPRLQAVSQLAVEEEAAKVQNRLADHLLYSPEDRYQHLLRTRPDLLKRVPQYQLASYLGVTPESLSRIRRRIAQT